MFRLLVLLLLASLIPAPALAGDASLDIGKLEGVYRDRFRNVESGGGSYMSTNELKIVEVGKGLAYVSVELHFVNHHECSLSGLAETEKGVLVHRSETGVGDEVCELRIVPKRGIIGFEDVGERCRSTCGARGAYDGAEFKIARRQKISASERRKILANAQEEIAEHKARKKARSDAKPKS